MYVFVFGDGSVGTSERTPLAKDFEDKTKTILRCVPDALNGGVIVQVVKSQNVFTTAPTTVVDADQVHKVVKP